MNDDTDMGILMYAESGSGVREVFLPGDYLYYFPDAYVAKCLDCQRMWDNIKTPMPAGSCPFDCER